MCVPGAYYFGVTSLHVGLHPMPKVCKDRSRSPTPRFRFVGSSANKGCDVGKFWCTQLVSQFVANKKSYSVTKTYVAFIDAAGAAGGHDIAKSGHCRLAYKNTATYVTIVVLTYVQVPQPDIVV